jgi:hypothetical protein
MEGFPMGENGIQIFKHKGISSRRMEKNNLWRLDQMADYFFVTDQLW